VSSVAAQLSVEAPFRVSDEAIEIDLPGARALFTTRRGGVSTGPFASLNLGLWTGDEPECVAANRERVAERVGISRERFAQGRQVHGTAVRRLREGPEPGEEPAPADGQATSAHGVAPVVLVADCLPVALAADGAVAMVHAGWRGLAGGVLEAGVAALCELGGAGPVEAAIGPGAGGCCYEVGTEVVEAFAGQPEAVRGLPDGTHRLDLKLAARKRLLAAGVGPVHDVGICTLCADPTLLFSHRRDGGRTGRQAGVAWRR
jgi:YfiH family protein